MCRTTFSHPSQSECYFRRQASSSVARLFQTPLSQNETFDLKLRALSHDFFRPLSVRILLLSSSFELCRTTFSHPSQSECYFRPQASSSVARLFQTSLSQNATFDFKPQALSHDFFTPLSIRTLLLSSSFELNACRRGSPEAGRW